MRDPRPFTVSISGKFSFTVHARSLEAARVCVAARLADTTGVLIVAQGIAAMIDTRDWLAAMACISAMQKCIRRGMEKEAMQFACELMHTAKPSTRWSAIG